MKTLLKLFDATLLDSSECHLHHCDLKHSLSLLIYLLLFLDTQRNSFPINLGTSKINYFLLKVLESYGNCKLPM